jgi:hypothetical protein
MRWRRNRLGRRWFVPLHGSHFSNPGAVPSDLETDPPQFRQQLPVDDIADAIQPCRTPLEFPARSIPVGGPNQLDRPTYARDGRLDGPSRLERFPKFFDRAKQMSVGIESQVFGERADVEDARLDQREYVHAIALSNDEDASDGLSASTASESAVPGNVAAQRRSRVQLW